VDTRAPRTGNQSGWLFNILLTLIILFVPFVGHIICSVYILGDDLTRVEKGIWLVLVWLLFPIAGPLLYLLVGQRRNRVLGS
jgi:uncharacterized membrane protein YhaH (DUF805 family)